MGGILFIILLFCLLGTIVQYTNFGNLKEKKKSEAVQFDKKYEELLAQSDKMLLNRKKIWALFLLCFSLPRNVLMLFYDIENNRKVCFLRILKVVAFFWITFDMTYLWAFTTFPLNFNEYPYYLTQPRSVILVMGMIFGFDILIFYIAF